MSPDMRIPTLWFPNRSDLYRHRRWLETGNFSFRKKRNCTVRVAKIKALISYCEAASLFSHMQNVGFLMMGLKNLH